MKYKPYFKKLKNRLYETGENLKKIKDEVKRMVKTKSFFFYLAASAVDVISSYVSIKQFNNVEENPFVRGDIEKYGLELGLIKNLGVDATVRSPIIYSLGRIAEEYYGKKELGIAEKSFYLAGSIRLYAALHNLFFTYNEFYREMLTQSLNGFYPLSLLIPTCFSISATYFSIRRAMKKLR